MKATFSLYQSSQHLRRKCGHTLEQVAISNFGSYSSVYLHYLLRHVTDFLLDLIFV